MDGLSRMLDEAADALRFEPSVEIIDRLAVDLAEFHDKAQGLGILSEFSGRCRSHALHSMIMEDPYSLRAFKKPRGYPGDAVMLDYIYRPKEMNLSPVGQVVHQATVNLPNAESIRWRRSFLASLIQDTVSANRSAKIFSVASGHMRELGQP